MVEKSAKKNCVKPEYAASRIQGLSGSKFDTQLTGAFISLTSGPDCNLSFPTISYKLQNSFND